MNWPGGSGGTHRVPREAGGTATNHRVYSNPAPTVDRARGNTNDSQIIKNKEPWFHKGYYIPPGSNPSNLNWTEAGPVRQELHLRTMTYRKEAGAFNSDTTGMHTIVPKMRTNRGSQKPAVMVSGRQSRLTTVIFRGQTYSETTLPQGSENKK